MVYLGVAEYLFGTSNVIFTDSKVLHYDFTYERNISSSGGTDQIGSRWNRRILSWRCECPFAAISIRVVLIPIGTIIANLHNLDADISY